KSTMGRTGSSGGRPCSRASSPQCMLGAAPRLLGCFSFFRSRQIDAGAPRFRETDGDRLFCGSRAVLALADMMHFFTNEFAGLCRRGFTLTLVALRPFDRFLLGHC